MTELLWAPSEQRINETLISAFMAKVAKERGHAFADYDDIWQWSVDHIEEFWESLWDFCQVKGERSGAVIRNKNDLFNCEFYPETTLNYAENLIEKCKAEPAVIFRHESGRREELTRQQLVARVSQVQQALKSYGVKKGDRVAGYVPNIPEALIAMLATTSLGAVWSSCSPDFGVSGLIDRFGQIEPKVLFTADGYHYNGKQFDSLAVVSELQTQLLSLERIVVMPLLQQKPDINKLGEKAQLLSDLYSAYTPEPITYTPVGFRDPLFILFSSGTTGLPKCFVHSVGGTLLHHLKEHQLQGDIRPGDRLLYFTTCGWAMWNWLVSALASGATIVMFEGSPTYPGVDCLANIVEQEKVTHFGTSAKYLDSLSKQEFRPIESHDFGALRTVFSTGSPLSEQGFRYVYQSWKKDVCLSSISGGTDVIGCFVGGDPIGPVYAGQCQKRHLGMDVQVFDGEGKSIIGEPGELVCLSPHPAMPLGFLNDPKRERYFNEYFAKYKNVWCHSDWVTLTKEKGMVFYGRSDATLNPGGVRIGTAEIYRQVETIEEVLESVVIGQNWDNDVRVVLFVRLKPGVQLTERLQKHIKAEIRSKTTPRHVPGKIIAVDDIPRTHSGKISELAVRDTVHNRPVKNLDALANPECLDLFRGLPELLS